MAMSFLVDIDAPVRVPVVVWRARADHAEVVIERTLGASGHLYDPVTGIGSRGTEES
jgi:hypothetical protein